MGKKMIVITASIISMGALLICSAPDNANAGVNVGIGINIGPPPIVVPAPPEVVLVPGSQVYFVPGVDFDVFFYDGFWWSPRGDRWYRSRDYNGPWRIINHRYIPGPVFRVPHDYRRAYGRERHIPYGEWREHRGMARGHGRGEDFRGRGEHRGHGHER